MSRIRLLHWKRAEADAHLRALAKAGHQVDYDEQFRPALLKSWRESPPQAFVIDLSRLPSQGREIAITLRQSAATRQVPIIFCGGDAAKVDAVRMLLPDAAYCELSNLAATLKKALTSPPADPIRPTAMMDRYKSRSAAEKLGIKQASTVALLHPPRDLEHVLGPLPPGVHLQEADAAGPHAHVHLCFVHDAAELAAVLSRMRGRAGSSKLWIAWRKGGKAAAGDVTENLLRDQALDLGLVDYKVCSVNSVWSAMCFALKRG
jgi:CheY-like chemotaxis protein